jgi:hypothetical protein
MDLLWGVLKAIFYYLILNLFLAPNIFANEVLKNSASDSWEKAGYINPTIFFLDSYIYSSSDEGEYTHGLELDVVVLRGSGWDKDTIKKRVKHLADIYKQCSLKFINVKLIEIDPLGDRRLDFFPGTVKIGITKKSGVALPIVLLGHILTRVKDFQLLISVHLQMVQQAPPDQFGTMD